MYCVKCGKQTEGDETLCKDCKAAENATVAKSNEPIAQNAPNTKTNANMLCFGRALASAIMGFGVFIISNVLNSGGWRMLLISMIFMIIIDVAAIVMTIIFGSQAIRAYGTFKTDNTNKKPLPAFVLGIIGVILAGIATVMVLIFLMIQLPVAYA
ncbi:MAG: hypothetical protein K2F90_03235 [Clostridiales bacterium]|nr:hypothetical protein [Clostridiales bacterium]